MTADELASRIDADLAACDKLENWHGITLENVNRVRIPPRKVEMLDSFTNQLSEFWIVADECPESTEQGYLVVFDEPSKSFGLAVKGRNGVAATFIGCYGNFVETLNGM